MSIAYRPFRSARLLNALAVAALAAPGGAAVAQVRPDRVEYVTPTDVTGPPPLPGALPPGLYRAGAIPAPPPAFYDPTLYYLSPATAYPGSGYGRFGYGGYVSPRHLERRARLPYDTALHDAQSYHYLNQIIRRDESLQARGVTLTQQGTALFRAGDYQRAAMVLLDATQANHGDALARVRAGHAFFALAQYRPAVEQIRRAFELQPPLANLPYDLRDEYGRAGDFEQHAAALRQAAARRPDDASTVTMLGYVQYYTAGPGAALETLRRAKRLDPGNELIDKLLAVAEQIGRQPDRAPEAEWSRPDENAAQPVEAEPVVRPRGARTKA
ncbi:MAG: hypothetical protein U1A27_07070 [Phycisphaerae bacterium]